MIFEFFADIRLQFSTFPTILRGSWHNTDGIPHLPLMLDLVLLLFSVCDF
jgi:hypothetical protein